ncbi:LamB/YcsF family protein, partial [Escherichia coli]|uniref:LamB/YcsF family protein n=1 Tax=Escherichia coli TaxID=562 RepID=UPI0034D980A7
MEIQAATLYQIGALQAFLTVEGGTLQHVKAHGALYMRIHEDRAAGEAFCHAVQHLASQAYLIVLAGAA